MKELTMYNNVGLSVDEEKHANTETIIINEPQMINNVGNAKLNCGDISNTLPMETRIQRPNNNSMNPAIFNHSIYFWMNLSSKINNRKKLTQNITLNNIRNVRAPAIQAFVWKRLRAISCIFDYIN